MRHYETETGCRNIFKGRVVDLRVHSVTLENGSAAHREVVHHPGGACIAALDDQGMLLLVRQFRFPFGRELLELPAGKLEPGEDPMAAAHRELEEETGYMAQKLTLLGRLNPTPAYCTEVIHIFTTSGVVPGRQHLDRDEFLSVVKLPLAEAVAMVLDGRITDAKTQVGVLMLQSQICACNSSRNNA